MPLQLRDKGSFLSSDHLCPLLPQHHYFQNPPHRLARKDMSGHRQPQLQPLLLHQHHIRGANPGAQQLQVEESFLILEHLFGSLRQPFGLQIPRQRLESKGMSVQLQPQLQPPHLWQALCQRLSVLPLRWRLLQRHPHELTHHQHLYPPSQPHRAHLQMSLQLQHQHSLPPTHPHASPSLALSNFHHNLSPSFPVNLPPNRQPLNPHLRRHNSNPHHHLQPQPQHQSPFPTTSIPIPFAEPSNPVPSVSPPSAVPTTPSGVVPNAARTSIAAALATGGAKCWVRVGGGGLRVLFGTFSLPSCSLGRR